MLYYNHANKVPLREMERNRERERDSEWQKTVQLQHVFIVLTPYLWADAWERNLWTPDTISFALIKAHTLYMSGDTWSIKATPSRLGSEL